MPRLCRHSTASRSVRCGMDLQEIIPGTLKQGYLTKSPPLDKGGIKVRSRHPIEPLRNSNRALAFNDCVWRANASSHQNWTILTLRVSPFLHTLSCVPFIPDLFRLSHNSALLHPSPPRFPVSESGSRLFRIMHWPLLTWFEYVRTVVTHLALWGMLP